ncbi:regulator of g protein signaling [Anaeramoeba flamelloides]|uniref:Regulator of g protein signaling n=1 Tax=Anaeramoeba flamelloides TaxID=1746091 RepID=A0ABQ8Y6T9_9EUKA|nr:regulator of g protein signaling [Anaeramoeba flamelloides]
MLKSSSTTTPIKQLFEVENDDENWIPIITLRRSRTSLVKRKKHAIQYNTPQNTRKSHKIRGHKQSKSVPSKLTKNKKHKHRKTKTIQIHEAPTKLSTHRKRRKTVNEIGGNSEKKNKQLSKKEKKISSIEEKLILMSKQKDNKNSIRKTLKFSQSMDPQQFYENMEQNPKNSDPKKPTQIHRPGLRRRRTRGEIITGKKKSKLKKVRIFARKGKIKNQKGSFFRIRSGKKKMKSKSKKKKKTNPEMGARQKKILENKKKFRKSIGLHNTLPKQIEINLQNVFNTNAEQNEKLLMNASNEQNNNNSHNQNNGNKNENLNKNTNQNGNNNKKKNKKKNKNKNKKNKNTIEIENSSIFIPDFTSIQQGDSLNPTNIEFDESGLPTFDSILNNYLSNFVQFSASEYNDENILFWSRVNEFKKYFRFGRQEKAKSIATQILNSHILENSEKEINISWELRQELMLQLKNIETICPEPTVFDKAHKIIYEIMSGDLYLSFFRTPFYQEIVNQIEISKK